MKYVLKNTKTKEYFKGYEGRGKGPGNKPTWTNEIAQAVRYNNLEIALRLQRRLFYQSQFVTLIPLKSSSVTLPDSPTVVTAYHFSDTSAKKDAAPEKVNLKDLEEISEKFLKKSVLSYMDVPLRIDESLKGNEHYVAISHELYERLENEQMKRG